MVKLYAYVLIFTAGGFALAQQSPPPDPPGTRSLAATLDMGRAIAQEKCIACHAIGVSGTSANPQAPPLRTLGQKYPIDSLSEAFAEGVLVGHSNMPEFEMEPAQIDALLTYIESIQGPAHTRAKKSKAG
jgi:cytochrome c